jgi:hypothetical protein
LELPPSQDLVGVWADGRPALVEQLNRQRWRLPLRATRLPQFLGIVTRSVEEGYSGTRRFELARPRLSHDGQPIAVELSLWSFGHASISASPSVDGAGIVSAVDQAALKLDRLVSITEAATPSAIELPMPEGHDWYLPWAARLAGIRDQTLGTLESRNGDGTVSQISTAEEQLERASQRLDAWLDVAAAADGLLAWPEFDPPLDSIKSTFLPELERDPLTSGRWLYCVSDGDAPRISVDLAPNLATPRRMQVRVLLVIAALAVTAITIIRNPAAKDVVSRWPHAAGFLMGLLYWAWLWPSWFGLVIAGASLWLSVRPGWPGRSLRTEGSTILRIGNLVSK